MLGRNTYLHHPRPTTVDLDGVEILLHHHHQYLHHHHHHQLEAFPGLYLAANAPPPLDTPTFNQENGEPSSKAVKKQTTAKKDRHSKIHTAQGPRDRRVRLSIGIARKFFDLQEMLGFDKPSKTLDWLLTKSKAAIKELVQKKQGSASSPKSGSSPCACEELISSPAAGDLKFKVGKDPQQAAVSLARESRAKARARARERTLEKMCIKQLGAGHGERCNGSDLINPSFECRNNNHNHQVEFLQLSAAAAAGNSDLKGINENGGFHFPNDEAATQDLIEESSVMIKRKNKNNNPCSLLGFQQNLVFSTDLNSNYMIPPNSANNNAHENNWDVFGLNSQSNLHAVLDHHKFFNSNSNI